MKTMVQGVPIVVKSIMGKAVATAIGELKTA
jgi:hypothetical protein